MLKRISKIIPAPRWLFLIVITSFYFCLWIHSPNLAKSAVNISINIILKTILPLLFVFLLMILFNLFIKLPRFAEFMEKGTPFKRKLFAAVAGILSAGPIYAWYPMLKDLHGRGIENSLLAVFLVNRAIKPFLLPIMIAFFGLYYAITLNLMIFIGSLLVGSVIGLLLDRPTP
jgi:uncharacterized membrane protein YraQ (UPF0718 family)